MASQIVEQYGYVVHLAIAVQEELLDLFFVRAEMHIFHEYTPLVPVVLGVGTLLTIGRFLLLIILTFAILFSNLIFCGLILVFTLLLLLFG